jgi:hypothetical protein
MPNFKIITNINDIQLPNGWTDAIKFKSRNRIVDANGKQVSWDYKGYKYQLVYKKERIFSCIDRIGRGILAGLAIVLSLGFALFSKHIRQLLTETKEKIRFGIAIPDFHQNNTACKKEEVFPLEKVSKECEEWMKKFSKNFAPTEVKKYTLQQLYQKDVIASKEETEDMQKVYSRLWTPEEDCWVGQWPEDWKKHSGSKRSCNLENNKKYPNYIFKFCSGSPDRGVPAAHFLRVPKGKEIRKILEEESLDELEVVQEDLIAIKTLDKIQTMEEREQCYQFVVKSKKIELLNTEETISELSSLPQQKQIKVAKQIMEMICRSGLGDVGFHNFNINKKTSRLVIVDTEPIYGSLLLDEGSKFDEQYQYSNTLLKRCSNLQTVATGLSNMVKACQQLPVFRKVAEIYQSEFNKLFQQNAG